MKIRHLLLIGLFACFPQPSYGAVSLFDPVFEIVPAPSSVRLNDYESNTRIRVFKERVNYSSSTSFRINASGPRTVDSFGDFNDSHFQAGIPFDSYFVHMDTVANSSQLYGPATLRFDRPIIGIIGRDPDILNTSQLFGAPGTLYPEVGNNQHFDYNNNPDFFTLLPDGHSIRIQAQAGISQDQIRILTAPSVPEPTSIGLLLAGAFAIGTNRRR